MAASLTLAITDYKDTNHWRWLLTDAAGKYVADHEVALDPSAIEHRGFADLPGYLRDFSANKAERELLREVGAWMGEKVFGGLAGALRERRQDPATVIRVMLPATAQDLVFRPFELSHLDGETFAQRGIRFV